MVNFNISDIDAFLSNEAFINSLPPNVQIQSIIDAANVQAVGCPIGYYCPPDTTDPIPCPKGTYGTITNAVSENECSNCTAGFYCNFTATLIPATCPGGFYCGVRTATPTQCSAGYYCGSGSSFQTQCPAGFYCPTAQTVSALPCSANFWSSAGALQCLQCTNYSENGGNSSTCFCSPGYTNNTIPASGGSTYPSTVTVNLIQSDRLEGMNVVPGVDDAFFTSMALKFDGTPKILKTANGYNNITIQKGQVVTFVLSGADAAHYLVLGLEGAELADFEDNFNSYDNTEVGGFVTGLVKYLKIMDPCTSNSCVNQLTTGVTGQKTGTITWDTSTATSNMYYVAHTFNGEFTTTYAFNVLLVDSFTSQNTQAMNGPSTKKHMLYGDKALLNAMTDGTYSGTYNIQCRSYGVSTFTTLQSGITFPYLWDTTNLDVRNKHCRVQRSTGSQKGVILFYDKPNLASSGFSLDPSIINNGLGFYCKSCDTGSYKNTISQTQCTPCPSGTYCDTLATITPKTCPAGYYCKLNTTNPIHCPAGSYSSATGLQDFTQCSFCPIGYYCPNLATLSPILCNAGTSCGLNTFSPTTCTNNTFSFAGVQRCEKCSYFSTSQPGSSKCDCDAGFTNQTDIFTYTLYPSSSIPKLGVVSSDFTYFYPSDFALYPQKFILTENGYNNLTVKIGQTVTFTVSDNNPSSYIAIGNRRTVNAGLYEMASIIDRSEVLEFQKGVAVKLSDCTDNSNNECLLALSNGITGQRTKTIVWNTTNMNQGVYFIYYSADGLGDYSFTITVILANSYFYQNSVTNDAHNLQMHYLYGDKIMFTNPVVPLSLQALCRNYGVNTWTLMASGITPFTWDTYNLDLKDKSCVIKDITLGNNRVKNIFFYEPTNTDLGYFCQRCPQGYYKPNSGNYQCVQCSPGTFCNTTATITPYTCPTGNYCPIGTVIPVNCPAGTFRSGTGGSSLSDCSACPVAKYCEIQTTTPISCPAGTYRNVTNAASVSDCFPCPAGSYCPVETTNPTQCPAGKFRDTTNAMSVSDCSQCTAGFYCPTTGTVTPLTCPETYYCTLNTITPTSCGVGTYCPSGSSAAPQCPAGYYCPTTGTTSPIPCPANFWSAAGAQQCLQCTNYSQNGGASATCACGPGYTNDTIPASTGGSSSYPSTLTVTLIQSDRLEGLKVVPGQNDALYSGMGIRFDGTPNILKLANGYNNITIQKGQVVTFVIPNAGEFNIMYLGLEGAQAPTASDFLTITDYSEGFNFALGLLKYLQFLDPCTGTSCITPLSSGVTGQGTGTITWDTSTATADMYYLYHNYQDSNLPTFGFSVLLVDSFTTQNTQVMKGPSHKKHMLYGDKALLNPMTDSTYSGTYNILCRDYGNTVYTTMQTGITFPYTWNTQSLNLRNKICLVSRTTGGTFRGFFFFYDKPSPTSSGSSFTLDPSIINNGLGFYCKSCDTGSYKNTISQTPCTPCPAGTYCDTLATVVPKNCSKGYYCPLNTTTPQNCPANTWGYDPSQSCALCANFSSSSPGSVTCQCNAGYSNLTDPVPVSTTPTLPSIVTYQVYAAINVPKLNVAATSTSKVYLVNSDGYQNFSIVKGQTVKFNLNNADSTGQIRLVTYNVLSDIPGRFSNNWYLGISARAQTCTTATQGCTTIYNTGVTGSNPSSTTITWDTSSSNEGDYLLMYVNDAAAATSTNRFPIIIKLLPQTNTPSSRSYKVDFYEPKIFVFKDVITIGGFTMMSEEYFKMTWATPWNFYCYNKADAATLTPTTIIETNIDQKLPYVWDTSLYPFLKDGSQFCQFVGSNSNTFPYFSSFPNPWDKLVPITVPPSIVTHVVYASKKAPNLGFTSSDIYNTFLLNGDGYMNITVYKGQTVSFDPLLGDTAGKIRLVQAASTDFWIDGGNFNFQLPLYARAYTCTSTTGNQCTQLYTTGVQSANPTASSLIWDTSTSNSGTYYLMYTYDSAASTTQVRYLIVVYLANSHITPNFITLNADSMTTLMFWGDTLTITEPIGSYTSPVAFQCFMEAQWVSQTSPSTTITTNMQFPYTFVSNNYPALNPYNERSIRQFCSFLDSNGYSIGGLTTVVPNPYQPSSSTPSIVVTSGAVTLGFTCQACLLANFKPTIGQTQCTPCPTGTYCDTLATITPKPCISGYFCPASTSTPSQCLANTWSGTGFSQCSSCTNNSFSANISSNCTCNPGFFQDIPSSDLTLKDNGLGYVCPPCSEGYYKSSPGQSSCLPCPPGTYCDQTGFTTPKNCTPGSYCPLNSTLPTSCPAGKYMPSFGAMQLSDCITCPTGQYCGVNTSTPISCPNGTFSSATGAVSVSTCASCPVNNYCPTKSVNPVPCPANTNSLSGASTILQCRCNPGYRCTYSKVITAAVTLNTTVNDFQFNIGGVRDAFINAVAAAAKVDRSKVFIIGFAPKSNRRRLLARDEYEQFTSGGITVIARVHGATHLHDLEYHLARHHKNLHIEHSWNDNHSMQIK